MVQILGFSSPDFFTVPGQAAARDSVSGYSSSDFFTVLDQQKCAHCRQNPRVTYNDDDDDVTGVLDDTTLCAQHPQQCWFKTHNLFINRFECALSRLGAQGETASHGYSCPCIVPSKYVRVSLNEHVEDYLHFVRDVVRGAPTAFMG